MSANAQQQDPSIKEHFELLKKAGLIGQGRVILKGLVSKRTRKTYNPEENTIEDSLMPEIDYSNLVTPTPPVWHRDKGILGDWSRGLKKEEIETIMNVFSVKRYYANNEKEPDTMIAVSDGLEWDLSVPAQLAEYRILRECTEVVAESAASMTSEQGYYFYSVEAAQQQQRAETNKKVEVIKLITSLEPVQKRSLVQYIGLAKGLRVDFENATLDDYVDEFNTLCLEYPDYVAEARKTADMPERTLIFIAKQYGVIEQNVTGMWVYPVRGTKKEEVLGRDFEDVVIYFKKNNVEHIKSSVKQIMVNLQFREFFEETPLPTELPASTKDVVNFAKMSKEELSEFILARSPRTKTSDMPISALIKKAQELDI